MTIFLYGPDAYRLKQGLGQVVSGYKKKYPGSLNFFSFDLSDKEQRSRFEDSLKTVSFFEEAKLMIARNSFVSKEISEWMKGVLARNEIDPERSREGSQRASTSYGIDKTKSVVVAVIGQSSQKDLEKINKNLFKDLVSNSSTVRNFEYLEGTKLLNWVRSEFASLNCSIDTASARALIDLAGNESWWLASEIEKLANYKHTKGTFAQGAITVQDIKTLVSGRTNLDIFDFVDAVVSKNKAKAYELLYQEVKNGRDPHYLLAMMVYGFRSRANKFSLEELRRAFGKLLEMDTLSKNGVVNLTDALFGFIIS